MAPHTEAKQRYWFPAKRYGWGWGPPITWQGWVVSLVWLAVVVGGLMKLGRARILAHAVFIGIMGLVLLLVCYLKGEPPRWRWGD
jgi:hypothetical protein